MVPRSSVVPETLKYDCSAGWAKADVKESRTGNGVKLRIWMPVICRIRRYNSVVTKLHILESSVGQRTGVKFPASEKGSTREGVALGSIECEGVLHRSSSIHKATHRCVPN